MSLDLTTETDPATHACSSADHGVARDATSTRRHDSMIRQGFLMRLKPGAAEEYRRWHRQVPRQVELDEEAAGVIQETIFIHGDTLFVFSVIEDEGTWDRARHSAASLRWAETMAPYLVTGDDGVVLATQLDEVYHHGVPASGSPGTS
jgi:L-rhamnose mutarotase